LFSLVILGAEDVVLSLFEKAFPCSGMGLGTFSVGSPWYGISHGRHLGGCVQAEEGQRQANVEDDKGEILVAIKSGKVFFTL